MSVIKKTKIPTFADERGKLSVVEFHHFVDWEPKRLYYVTDVSKERGGHAVKGEKKIYICVQGTISGRIHDGKEWEEFEMHGPEDAIIVNDICYREFKHFSKGAVLLSVSNMPYQKENYINDFDEFLQHCRK